MLKLSQRIKKLREARGLSIAEMSTRMGRPASTLASLEAGGDSCNIATLRRVAIALELREDRGLAWLAFGTGKAPSVARIVTKGGAS